MREATSDDVVNFRERANARKWLTLSPNLVEALEGLAATEGLSLGAFLSVLINEALAARLRKR